MVEVRLLCTVPELGFSRIHALVDQQSLILSRTFFLV